MTPWGTIRDARINCVDLTLEAGPIAWKAADDRPELAEILARVRIHKSAILSILGGNACRHCLGTVDFAHGGALAFDDGTIAHLACHDADQIAWTLHRAGLACDPRFDDELEVSPAEERAA